MLMNKRKKRIIFSLLSIITIIVIGTIVINLYIVLSTKEQIITIDEIEKDHYDAILVLGCKAYEDGPSPMLAKRLDKGIEIYNNTKIPIVLSGDYVDNNYDEVNIMRDYVVGEGIDKKSIFLDYYGFSTYDSLYRIKHVYNAKKIIVVTQKYHIARALYLANELDIEAVGIVANDIPQKLIMLKNEIREILSRDKNYFKGIIKPESKYLENINSVE